MPAPVGFSEQVLQYVWAHRLYDGRDLTTLDGQPVHIGDPGHHNLDAGPDFAGAQITINGQRRQGPVELHLREADWHAHHHSTDPAYAQVILHVVWRAEPADWHARPVGMPVLELYGRVSPYRLDRLSYLNRPVIDQGPLCRPLLHLSAPDTRAAMRRRALEDRLRERAVQARPWLEALEGDWEQLAFVMMARALCLPLNGETARLVGMTVRLRDLLRLRDRPMAILAILLGQAGFLEKAPKGDAEAREHADLLSEYTYQRQRLSLTPPDALRWTAARMLPAARPQVRLRHLAAMVAAGAPLLDVCLDERPEQAARLWQVPLVELGPEPAPEARKTLAGRQALEGVLINMVAPIKALFGIERDDAGQWEGARTLLTRLPVEDNRRTRWFGPGYAGRTAADSQGLAGLETLYCRRGRCLECGIGQAILAHPPATLPGADIILDA